MKILIVCLYNLLFNLVIQAQNGLYMEYTMTAQSTSKTPTGIFKGGLFKSYLLPNTGSRTEMEVKMPQMPQAMKSVFIYRSDKPGTSILINEKNKTFTEREKITTPTQSPAAYSIKVIGNEKIGAYNCVHSQISRNEKVVYDLWTTKDIPGYNQMAKMLKTGENDDFPQVFDALKKQKAEGFTVKMVSPAMTMTLSHYEQKSLPVSLFAAPADFTRLDAQAFMQQQMQDMMKR